MAQKFNICRIAPDNYVHSGAFLEIADVLLYGLRALGHEAEIQVNSTDPSARNIMIGVHLLSADVASQLPSDTIILNTEQLGGVYSDWNENILNWFSNDFTLWDYSDSNVGYLQDFGVKRVEKLKLGYQEELNRIQLQQEKPVDVLFYGCLNERRKTALLELEARGLKVKFLHGVFGNARDEWIARSRLVLNLHYFDSEIFEIVRVFYLMTNGIPVASELNPTTKMDDFYRQGLLCAPYDQLSDQVVELLEDKDALTTLGATAKETIMQRPQSELLREIM